MWISKLQKYRSDIASIINQLIDCRDTSVNNYDNFLRNAQTYFINIKAKNRAYLLWTYHACEFLPSEGHERIYLSSAIPL
jgi:hypothetical protein